MAGKGQTGQNLKKEDFDEAMEKFTKKIVEALEPVKKFKKDNVPENPNLHNKIAALEADVKALKETVKNLQEENMKFVLNV